MTVSSSRASVARDAAACSLVVAGMAVYFHYWPHDLNTLDEGLYLYEAKRILRGDVMYRDFFEVVTPASFYAMALLFKLFGVSMETARAGMFGLHALIACVLYATCRRVRIRRSIATLCAVSHTALFYTIFPLASPHWFGTFLCLLALFVAVRGAVDSPPRAGLLGVVIGLLAIVQHQKAPALGAGVLALILFDAFSARRSGAARARLACLLAYAGGGLAIVLPCLLGLLTVVPAERLYELLVHVPLTGYRRYHEHRGWGYFPWVPWLLANYGATLVYLTRILPGAAILVLARALYRANAGAGIDEVRPAIVVALFALFAGLTIYYNPDFAHLGIIGPLWIVPVALLLEWTVAWLDRRARWPGAAVTVALALLLALQLYDRISWRRALFPYSFETAFGRVDFSDPEEFAISEAIRERVKRTASHELFTFPGDAARYLITDAVNPTRFQLLLAGYNEPEHFDEVIRDLERKKVPFIAYSPFVVRPKTNPIVQYLLPRYERVNLPSKSRVPIIVLYQRKSDR